MIVLKFLVTQIVYAFRGIPIIPNKRFISYNRNKFYIEIQSGHKWDGIIIERTINSDIRIIEEINTNIKKEYKRNVKICFKRKSNVKDLINTIEVIKEK